jgi:hypothetical protein
LQWLVSISASGIDDLNGLNKHARLQSILVALVAAVILPGATHYPKKTEGATLPQVALRCAQRVAKTGVTSNEAPQAVSKLEMKLQCELPFDPCRLAPGMRCRAGAL